MDPLLPFLSCCWCCINHNHSSISFYSPLFCFFVVRQSTIRLEKREMNGRKKKQEMCDKEKVSVIVKWRQLLFLFYEISHVSASDFKIQNILTCFDRFYKVFMSFEFYNPNYIKHARNAIRRKKKVFKMKPNSKVALNLLP